MRRLTEKEVKEADKQVLRMRALVMKAGHDRAFALAEKLHRADPSNPIYKFRYAVMLGDHHDGLSEKQISRNKIRAGRMLLTLTSRHLYLFPVKYRRHLLNETYWFTEQYQKQYQLGLEDVSAGDKGGYYSKGVGATMLALKCRTNANSREAKKWADIAIKSLRRYTKYQPEYYSGFTFLAMAYGSIKRFDLMEKAFKKASRLSGRPLEYAEFCDCRIQVWQAWAKAAEHEFIKAKLNRKKG